MDEIVSILDRFIRRPSISKQTIEEILGVSLQPQPNNNPYWNFYEASCTSGPFATAQYREPGAETTSQARGVILTIRPELQVTEVEVRDWYGPGTIG